MKFIVSLGRDSDIGGWGFDIVRYEQPAAAEQIVPARTDRAYQGKEPGPAGKHTWCWRNYHIWLRLPFDRGEEGSGVFARPMPAMEYAMGDD